MAVWQAWGRCFKGVLLIKSGRVDTGLRLVRIALDELRKTGSVLRYAALLGVLAEGSAEDGKVAEGLAVIDDALDLSESREERWCIAELLRIKGELTRSGTHLTRPRIISGKLLTGRGAKERSPGNCAAISRARMWRDQNRIKEARELLAPVYDRFTEGFGTADLEAAKALIGDLRGQMCARFTGNDRTISPLSSDG